MNIQAYIISPLDHLFVLAFAVGFPLYAYRSYKKALPALLRGELALEQEYLHTMLIQWIFCFCGLAIWLYLQRDWQTLGFGISLDWQFALALVIVVIAIGVLSMQLLAVRRKDEKMLAVLAREFESVSFMMPRSKSQLNRFYGLSLTAGIVEEILWRGFLIFYLSHYLPLWAAAIVSAVAFGLGHAYQGVSNVPKIIAVGGVFSGLYVLSGSLWLLIALHIAMDVIQGRTAYDFMQLEAEK